MRESLLEQIAIRLGCQKKTAKSLVMVEQLAIRLGRQGMAVKSLAVVKQLAIPQGRQTALHGHSANPPKDGDLSRWLTPFKWLVMLEKILFVSALSLSTTVFAVGMGGINVSSGLGQQLNADIELVAVSKVEKASLIARLALPEAYKEAGLEYPYGNKFKFQIESRADGEPYLKVSSEQPINDPFVIMLVELSWSSGKMLREYTFLLDPPGYVPEQPAQPGVQAVAPVIQFAPPVTAAAPAGQVAPTELPAQATQATTIVPAPSEAAAASGTLGVVAMDDLPELKEWTEKAATDNVSELDEWVAVKRGDTMREVAERYRLADMSLDRMLVALYRVNADMFEGKNMNRIKAGKILRLPHQGEVDAVSQSDALREIRAQTADWNAYRQKLASAAPIKMQSQEAQQVVTGRISSSVADNAPVVKESAREVLKLSKGEAPGDDAAAGAGGKPGSAQDKKTAAQEDAIAKSMALKDEQTRVAMLEKQILELQHLAELKSALPEIKSNAAALQPVKIEAAQAVAASGVAASGVAPSGVAPSGVAASAVAATSAEKPKPMPKLIEPEPLLDQILAEPLYLAGGALLLLGLGGLGYVLIQRKKKRLSDDTGEPLEKDAGTRSEFDGSATGSVAAIGRIAAPVASSPDTGDFTRMGATEGAAPLSDHIDPIGEADLFLNFGRDAQAEEILKEALQSTPNDHRIHLKLLGIYANRVDVNSFSSIARQLKDSGDEDAWQQAYAMGRKLEPNNPMYGGSGSLESTGSATAQAAAFDVAQLYASDKASAPQPTTLDFDVALGSFSEKETVSPERDFLGDSGQDAILSFDVMAAGQAPEMDFDIAAGQSEGGQTEAALPETGDMIFDVMGTSLPAPAERPVAAKPAESDFGGMEFTIDFPVESTAEKAAPEVQPAGIGLAGISLNFDDTMFSGEAMPGGKDEHWQEVATKLDLAKAYQEMGDAGGAREILEEVIRDGDAGQREAAQTLINQLG